MIYINYYFFQTSDIQRGGVCLTKPLVFFYKARS